MADLIRKRDKTRKDIDELLLAHKNLVYYRLSLMGQLHNQDAESAAWEALWDALETFSVYDDTAFSTYACKCITNAVNTVLRRQQHMKLHVVELTELSEGNLLFTDNSYESSDTMRVVSEAFEEFMLTCTGVARDIMQLWRSTGFSISATDLAHICATSTSYVVRVQNNFRAYLSERLRR